MINWLECDTGAQSYLQSYTMQLTMYDKVRILFGTVKVRLMQCFTYLKILKILKKYILCRIKDTFQVLFAVYMCHNGSLLCRMYCEVFLSCVSVLFCKIRRPLVLDRIEHSLQCVECRVCINGSVQCFVYCALHCSAPH